MIKQFIKRLLGRVDNSEPYYLQHIENNGSFLRSHFSARFDDPVEGRKYIVLGKDSLLDCSVVFESKEGQFVVGNETIVSPVTIICRENITIEDHVYVSWGCTICDHSFHSLDYMDRRDDFQNMLANYHKSQNFNINKDWDSVESNPIHICSDVWIGMNSTIMPGVTIGRGAIIGAGSVVRKSVPEFTIVAGNPAEFVAEIPKY